MYVERQDAGYHCIAYNPDNIHMVAYCCFVKVFFTLGGAAARGLGMMQVPYTNTRRIKRAAKAIDKTQEPELKIRI